MIYKLNTETNTWHPASLRQDFPHTDFPRDLSTAVLPDGYAYCHPSPSPACGEFERTDIIAPTLLDGKLTQQWSITKQSNEEIVAQLTNAIQSHMDSKARERNYDGILSLCSYATSSNSKFAAEGQAGVEWRDAVWSTSYALMASVLEGRATIPTTQQMLEALPEFVWPEV